MSKPILDPCCGSRMFYFDKDNPLVDFRDNRTLSTTLCDGRPLKIHPDIIGDVTDIDAEDETFSLVIFDPPHLEIGSGWQVEKYGKLPPDWKEWMTKAFSECWRVLKPSGTLIFKWYEYHIALSEILSCIPQKPLIGNRRPKSSKTHWLVFFKEDSHEGNNASTNESNSSLSLPR